MYALAFLFGMLVLATLQLVFRMISEHIEGRLMARDARVRAQYQSDLNDWDKVKGWDYV